MARQAGDRASEAIYLTTIAICHNLMGSTALAIECLDKALKITGEIDDRHKTSMRLGMLGLSRSYLGEYPIAIDTLQRAVEIALEIGDRLAEAVHRSNLAGVYILEERYEEAIACATKSLQIAGEIRNPSVNSLELRCQAGSPLHRSTSRGHRAAAESARRYNFPVNDHNPLASSA